MAIAAPVAGARIITTDLSAFYNLLKGVTGSGETITLIYNAAGAFALQPSSDPAASTQLIQVKNNAGTVKFAIRADGSLVFSDASIQTTAGGPPVTTSSNNLAAGVAMSVGGTYYDGPTLTLAAGTYLLVGTVTILNGANAMLVKGKLWDSTTIFGSTSAYIATANQAVTMSMSAIVSPGGSTTYKISANSSSTSGTLSGDDAVAGEHPSHLRAIKVA